MSRNNSTNLVGGLYTTPLRDYFLAGLLISRPRISGKWGYKGEIQCNFALCVGQSYDGAAAMASERSGVTSIIQNESPLAYYFHYAMHCLNYFFLFI